MTDADTTPLIRRLTPWRQHLLAALGVYLFSRLCVIAGAALVAAELRADQNQRVARFPLSRWADPHYWNRPISESALRPMLDVLTSWDGIWYLRIARLGYPSSVRPDVNFEVLDARAAFFPAYPMLIRVADLLMPGGDVAAALMVNLLLGGTAVYAVGLLAREIFDEDVALRAMVLAAVFPGAFVLSFTYTEALFVAVAALTLLCLMRGQWLFAGVLAAIGTATRPNGVALVAACTVAAMVAVRDRREWRSLVAPLLAPLGVFGFLAFLDRRTGERGLWFRVQREAWDEGVSFGLTALRNSWHALARPLTSPTDTITAITVVALVVLVWFARQHRLPAPVVSYCACVVALMLLPATVTARPRFLYTSFPLLISAAAWFAVHRRHWWPWIVASCCVGLTTLSALYGVLGAIP